MEAGGEKLEKAQEHQPRAREDRLFLQSLVETSGLGAVGLRRPRRLFYNVTATLTHTMLLVVY